MTITATLARRIAVAALVLSAIAAAMIAALVATANGSVHAEPAAPVAEVVEVAPAMVATAVEVSPFLVALAPGTEFDAAHAEELTLAADRVCEGITAEVPVVVMADTLAAELLLTDEEARHFVNTAALVHC